MILPCPILFLDHPLACQTLLVSHLRGFIILPARSPTNLLASLQVAFLQTSADEVHIGFQAIFAWSGRRDVSQSWPPIDSFTHYFNETWTSLDSEYPVSWFHRVHDTHTDPDLVVPGARQRASVKRGRWRVFRLGRNASPKDTFIAVSLLLPVALQLRSPSLHNNKLSFRPGVDYSHCQHDGAATLLRRRKGGTTR